jgi:hypothetical protein
MGLHALDELVAVVGLLAEIVLLVILLVRRQYVGFPLFTLYVAFNLLSDIGVAVVAAAYPIHTASFLAFTLLPLQYLLDLGVLFEIGCKVLRPSRSSLPVGSIRVFVGLMVVALVGGTLLAWQFHDSANKLLAIKRPLDLTDSFLRMLMFVAIAGFAQILGIGWKDKVLQLATALSFASAADLIVSLAVRHAARFSDLDPIRGFAYLLELVFLVWVFTTKELPRREFSPQMERFLVTLAGRAKVARTALARTQVK